MKFRILVLSAAFLLTSAAFAQKKDVPSPCDNKTTDGSGFTECERIVIENHELKNQVLKIQAQLLQSQNQVLQLQNQQVTTQNTQVNKDFSDTVAKILAAHPGYTFKSDDPQYPAGRLEKVPEPAKK